MIRIGKNQIRNKIFKSTFNPYYVSTELFKSCDTHKTRKQFSIKGHWLPPNPSQPRDIPFKRELQNLLGSQRYFLAPYSSQVSSNNEELPSLMCHNGTG